MRAPDLVGPAGRGWMVNNASPAQPAWAAALATWIVNVPGAHPFWSHWYISVVHLRDLPGVKPAHKQFPEAGHELLIIALNPEFPVPDPDDIAAAPPRFLTPIDVCEQFGALTDQQAAQLCDGAVRTILDGRMSPDQDYRHAWRALLRNTVEHMVLGGHAKGSS